MVWNQSIFQNFLGEHAPDSPSGVTPAASKTTVAPTLQISLFANKSTWELCDWPEMNELWFFCSQRAWFLLWLAEKSWVAPVEFVHCNEHSRPQRLRSFWPKGARPLGARTGGTRRCNRRISTWRNALNSDVRHTTTMWIRQVSAKFDYKTYLSQILKVDSPQPTNKS